MTSSGCHPARCAGHRVGDERLNCDQVVQQRRAAPAPLGGHWVLCPDKIVDGLRAKAKQFGGVSQNPQASPRQIPTQRLRHLPGGYRSAKQIAARGSVAAGRFFRIGSIPK